jgi:hypothetical protein
MIEKWTSLPTNNARELSSFFIEMAISLFDRVERDTGREIMIGELLGSHPRVSIPVKVGDKTTLRYQNAGVVSFLKQMREKNA